ncbi:hypothetical protein [uncultured Desulfosarcina sp.]|uniref:hypothetical protein n=1 Tax=uncultured Desulfosarcina sp. TaxID=218289 RepID=UPI0029C97302|nr:hypothetical protein [uncultured Desulfosarcina sp.]
MTDTEKIENPVARAGEQLFQFAIDRGDMNTILDVVPPLQVPEKRAILEYEIQLLRIISVGWAIAFFLTDPGLKASLGQHFWENVRAFSTTLSASASLTMGSEIDYFKILKHRLDFYVGALEASGQIPDPAMAIGLAFAGVCGDKEDACAILAGSKMFTITINAVRDYLCGAAVKQD